MSFCQLTIIDPRFFRLPLHVTAGINTIIKIAEGEDAAMLGIPWSTEVALARNVEGTVGFLDRAIVDVDAIFVLECSIGTLPGSDASATAPKSHGRFRHPAGSKAVEEISLPGDFTVIHVCVSQFANVDLYSGQ